MQAWVSCSGVGQLLVAHMPWVAISVVSSVAKRLSEVEPPPTPQQQQQQREAVKCSFRALCALASASASAAHNASNRKLVSDLWIRDVHDLFENPHTHSSLRDNVDHLESVSYNSYNRTFHTWLEGPLPHPRPWKTNSPPQHWRH